MQYMSVLAAAVASYAFGALWYMALSKPWMQAAGIETNEAGRPKNGTNPIPYIVAFCAAVLVAGMMRHVLVLSGVSTPGAGFVAGLGIGLFLATPWLTTCYAFGMRPLKLILIDGGYTTIGSAIIGLVLTLF
ncbi:DUF1761 domain-containing protein [Thalassovita taeanensis]|uniref:DUF1761 domain-containing protein n=1 Tax=Thalassovita taeanensis TaxID=657014 RepID=A0A1H9JI04_9RHOB|nr:DUF1761 domain-containing protein [Thalassovita taeanensis]SEQ86185.1 Protein of unknown function [Thalassovita taeanensis]